MVRSVNRYKYNEQPHIREVLDSITENGLILDGVIADNPKRAVIRCAKNHAAKYACELCKECALQISDTQPANDHKHQELCLKDQINHLRDRPGSSSSKTKDDKNIAVLSNILSKLNSDKKTIKNSYVGQPQQEMAKKEP